MKVHGSKLVVGALVLLAAPAFGAGAPNLAIGAKKFSVSLVPAYTQCSVPDTSARQPLNGLNPSGGCTAISLVTPSSTFDEAAKGNCKTSIGVSGNLDVKLKGKCKGLLSPGVTPYTGNVVATALIRVTSHGCDPASGPVGTQDCTMSDYAFPVITPCSAGACNVSTSANGILAGAVVPGERGNVEIGQIVGYVGPNLAMSQGITLP